MASVAYAQQGILLLKYQNLTIRDNSIRNINGIGIGHRAGLTTAATDLLDLKIIGNDFFKVTQESINLDIGDVNQDKAAITENVFDQCASDGGTSYHVLVKKLNATALRIQNNNAINNKTKGYFYDDATCTDVVQSDNSPDILRDWVPVITSVTGAITSYAVNGAKYSRKGDIIFFSAQVTISDNGTGATAINMTLPIVSDYWGGGSGRELNVGMQMISVVANVGDTTLYKYDGTYPAATGDVLKVSGWYGV